MTTLEYGNKLAWPCHVACWLPTPRTKTEKPSTLATAAAASKASVPGNWLTSASKKGEIITIEVLRDAPPLLKILCEGGGACLVSHLLAVNTFSFALVRDVLLVASLVDPYGGPAYTFGCRFMCHQHAVECAAILKASISAPPIKKKFQQPSRPVAAAAGGPSDQQRHAELFLLETIAGGDLESAGSAWWQDFSQVVEELDQKWNRKNQQLVQQAF